MKNTSPRKNKLISKKKLVTAINLFEDKVDDKIESIKIYTSNTYEVTTDRYKYSVNISTNNVEKIYPDF